MTTNTMGREAGKDIRKRAMEGCPLARELLILRGMCSCQGDEKSVDDAEDRYLELAVLRDAVPALQAEARELRAEARELRAELARVRAALTHIKRVMGPKVPPCCDGCAAEWQETLDTANTALAAGGEG